MLTIEQIARQYPTHLQEFKRSMLREYLQYRILLAIFTSPHAPKLAFLGGTALRIVHNNTRFSEDLDFDNFDLSEVEFEQIAQTIQRSLEREGYAVEMRSVNKQAWRTYIRLPKVLFDNQLSDLREEKILIQFDTEPHHFQYTPAQAIINKFDVFARINVTPIDILLAQKIYAALNRKRAKGRDFYDIVFLLPQTTPNYDYLKQKLAISGPSQLKDKLLAHCQQLDFEDLANDVAPFLFNPTDKQKVALFPDYLAQAL